MSIPNWANLKCIKSSSGNHEVECPEDEWKLSEIRIEQINLSAETLSSDSWTQFSIFITSPKSQWNIVRCYADFCYLEEHLKSLKNSNDEDLSLPDVHYFSNCLDSPVETQQSFVAVKEYLKKLLDCPNNWTCIVFVQFFDDGCRSLLLKWSMERIRKIQRVC